MTNRNYSRKGFGSSYGRDEQQSNRQNRQGYGPQDHHYQEEFEDTHDAYYDDDSEDGYMNTGGYEQRGRYEENRPYRDAGYDELNDDEDVDERSFRRGSDHYEDGYEGDRYRSGDEGGYYRNGNNNPNRTQRTGYNNRSGSSQGRAYRDGQKDSYQQDYGGFRPERDPQHSERNRGTQRRYSQSGYSNTNNYGNGGQDNRHGYRSQNSGRNGNGASMRRNDQRRW